MKLKTYHIRKTENFEVYLRNIGKVLAYNFKKHIVYLESLL